MIQLCANTESFLKTGLDALSPDVLGYEVCSEAWEFMRLKYFPMWSVSYQPVGFGLGRTQHCKPQDLPSLTAALGKSIISFTSEILHPNLNDFIF